jgi:hypothetical protein
MGLALASWLLFSNLFFGAYFAKSSLLGTERSLARLTAPSSSNRYVEGRVFGRQLKNDVPIKTPIGELADYIEVRDLHTKS